MMPEYPAPGTPKLQPQLVDVSDFDPVIADFDGVVQEMTVAFAATRWPKVNLEPWLYYHEDKIVAAALVMVQPLPLRSGTLAVVKWGPILACEIAPDRFGIVATAGAHLQNEYAVRRRMMLSVMSRAERPPSANIFNSLLALGFKPGSKLLFPDRYLVKLRLSDAEQRKSFAQKWRYHLSKSEKQNLTFSVAAAERLPEFDALYAAMTDRKRFPDFSAYSTLASLFESPVAALRPQIFLVCRDAVPVAGAVIFTAGKTAAYLYGATNSAALDLRAGYFMQARIISWLRDNTNADWYDLGGTDGFHGLHQFKKGMVGSAGLVTPVPPIANYATDVRAKLAGSAAYHLRDGLQRARRLVNRYRGASAQPDQSRSP